MSGDRHKALGSTPVGAKQRPQVQPSIFDLPGLQPVALVSSASQWECGVGVTVLTERQPGVKESRFLRNG